MSSSSSIAPRMGVSPASGPSPPATNTKITKIVTSKEWVLPPRPKPGRKPSIDTPSTKRKAQNRAAQRAFRERRANRVSELEDKILEIEKERSIKEGLMNNHIKNLTLENNRLNKMLEDLKKQAAARQAKDERKYISPISSAATSPNTISSSSSGLHQQNDNDNDDGDCGVCLKDDCICETIGIKNNNVIIDNFKPMAAVPLNRKRSVEEYEDFTNKFKFKRLPRASERNGSHPLQLQAPSRVQTQAPLQAPIQVPIQSNSASFSLTREDDCGFCSDDSPCVCREAAREVEKLNKMNEILDREIETSLPPLKNVSRQSSLPVLLHPGPTVEFNKTEKKNDTISQDKTPNSSAECTGNPGTCLQCQTDPMSTLFCTSIANKDGETNHDSTTTTSTASTASTTRPSSILSQSKENVFISTADAYKTLSRHENFKMVNFNTLIGKLTTRGMLVEAGSVASVLRELDRKFSCSQ